MKKLITLILVFVAFGAKAQISSFPATEDFEAAFDTGTNVVFIPNWTGSIVRPSSTPGRLFADTAHFRNGAQALAAIPTSTTPDTAVVRLNLSTSANLSFNFWACTAKNGTVNDSRASLIKISTSIDGGVTYGPETLIGDSVIFANAYTSYNPYSYAFPANTNNQSDVRMRIVITRSNSGTGNAARIVIDDAAFIASTVDIFPPTTTAASATSISTVEVSFSEAVGVSAQTTSNYTGIPNLVSAVRNGSNDKVTLTFSPALTVGQFYTLTIANVADIAGNAMAAPQSYPIAFNNNTGNVKISEIMYNDGGTAVDSLEFIEIVNAGGSSIDIGAWKFTKGITYTFTTGTTIAPNQHIVLCRYQPTFNTYFPSVTATQWDANQALNNVGGETIALYNTVGTLIDSVQYNSAAPWDTMANGHGPSLVLCDESTNNDDPANWTASVDAKGTYAGIALYASPGTACSTAGLNSNNYNSFAIAAYPNPANDHLNVVFSSDARERYTLKVVDLSGRVMSTVNGTTANGENRTSVNVADLATGMYLLVIETASGNSQQRFVKN